MQIVEHTQYQATTFILKYMDPEFLQIVLDSPAERHAAPHVPVLGDVVLYKDHSLRAFKREVANIFF